MIKIKNFIIVMNKIFYVRRVLLRAVHCNKFRILTVTVTL